MTDEATLTGEQRAKIERDRAGWADSRLRREERMAAFEACIRHPTPEAHAIWAGHPLWAEFRSANGGLNSVMAASMLPCDPEVVLPFLVDNGADVHHRDRRGRNALSLCPQGSRKFRMVWVERLLRAGVDPAVQDQLGLTCLTSALRCGQLDLLDALIAAGARATDSDRRAALGTNHPDTLERFWEVFGGPDTPQACTAALGEAGRQHLWHQARLLLERGADPNALGDEVPVLIMACQRARPDAALIQALVARGADPLAHDANGRDAIATVGQMNGYNLARRQANLEKIQRAIAQGRDTWLEERLEQGADEAPTRTRARM